jgi:hypothetical protein
MYLLQYLQLSVLYNPQRKTTAMLSCMKILCTPPNHLCWLSNNPAMPDPFQCTLHYFTLLSQCRVLDWSRIADQVNRLEKQQ